MSINIPTSTAGIYLNVVTGAFGGSTTPGWDVNPWGTGTALSMFSTAAMGTALGGGPSVGTGATYFNLALGTLISAASTFGGTGVNTIALSTPLNFNSSNNIIGFRFINEAMGNQVQFGWMSISLSANGGVQPRAIVQFAYENTGAGIAAGAIPEPSTVALLGMMALGAVGVRAWRLRKAA